MDGTVQVTEIGTGVLTWHRYERVGDRYGCVFLLDMKPGNEVVEYFEDGGERAVALDASPVGQRGRLCAEVVARGRSGHIGDLAHGFVPPREEEDMPPIGSVHVLGEGTCFLDSERGMDGPAVGVKPDVKPGGKPDDPEQLYFWLDPKVLYLLHEQGVRLYFEHAA